MKLAGVGSLEPSFHFNNGWISLHDTKGKLIELRHVKCRHLHLRKEIERQMLSNYHNKRRTTNGSIKNNND